MCILGGVCIIDERCITLRFDLWMMWEMMAII